MYEKFVQEQFGVEVDFTAATERLGQEAAGVLFSMVVEYYAEWRTTQRYIEALAEAANDAAIYMRKHGKPYDLYSQPAVSLDAATRRLVAAHKALDQALHICGLLVTPE